MESDRFDAIIRTLSAGTSRRGVLAVLAGIAGLGGSAAAGKHSKRSRHQRGKAGRGRHGKTTANQEPQPQTRGSAACRAPGHPCEGNQECCNGGDNGTTICVSSGPGEAKRCTACKDGEIACANHCIPACKAQDQCHVAGVCDPTTGRCTNPARPDGAHCDDDDACTKTDTCQHGKCVGGNPVVCTAQDQCHVAGTCDSSSGACSNPPAPDGTACTTADHAAGQCVAGACVRPCVRDSDCPPGDRCGANGVCVNRSCCNGVAECGPHTTFGTCCAGLNVVGWCCCDSHPGAGDGWAGCFDGGDPFGDPPLPRPCPSGVFARGGPSSAPNNQGICLTGGNALQTCPG